MATHTLNFPGANLNASESTVVTATIGAGGLIVDTDTLVVNASTNRVGIGSDAPAVTLDVGGGVNISGVTELTGTDHATDVNTGTLTVAGGISTQTNLHASNVYTQGGLITNRAGTCKKTYSHNGTLPANATIANGTFTVNFSNHVFQAKIYATICEGTLTLSSINMDCVGGHITGGTPAAITLGEVVVVGHNSCPWSAEVTTTANAMTFKIDHAVVGDGNYDIFVEYLSSHADGRVVKFTEGGADEITFNY
tara:strand:- start:1156 stop:1911 length:756 start_codon:yes stop_codon:yes gene_type:complete